MFVEKISNLEKRRASGVHGEGCLGAQLQPLWHYCHKKLNIKRNNYLVFYKLQSEKETIVWGTGQSI